MGRTWTPSDIDRALCGHWRKESPRHDLAESLIATRRRYMSHLPASGLANCIVLAPISLEEAGSLANLWTEISELRNPFWGFRVWLAPYHLSLQCWDLRKRPRRSRGLDVACDQTNLLGRFNCQRTISASNGKMSLCFAPNRMNPPCSLPTSRFAPSSGGR